MLGFPDHLALTACQSFPPSWKRSTPRRIRTDTETGLSRRPLPVGIEGRKAPIGFEPMYAGLQSAT